MRKLRQPEGYYFDVRLRGTVLVGLLDRFATMPCGAPFQFYWGPSEEERLRELNDSRWAGHEHAKAWAELLSAKSTSDGVSSKPGRSEPNVSTKPIPMVTGPANPAASRYVKARDALMEWLDDAQSAALRGAPVPNSTEFEPVQSEYDSARRAFFPPSRVKVS